MRTRTAVVVWANPIRLDPDDGLPPAIDADVRAPYSWPQAAAEQLRAAMGEEGEEIVSTTYERPVLVVLGRVEELTLGSGNDGNDPCRDNPPRGFKQTGPADFIQGQANLATCSA